MLNSELLAQLRSELSDEELPLLWSDAFLYLYLDDAQTMFTRLTDGIADASTAAVCNIAYAPGNVWLALHPSILKIRSVIFLSTGQPVIVMNQEDMSAKGYRFNGTTGPLNSIVEGMEENRVRTFPIPTDTDTLVLTVFRKPLLASAITLANAANPPEIAPEHHINLSLWAKYRAYNKKDAETYDKFLAEKYETQFRTYCAAVKLEQQMKRHKVRTVAYGGI